ncbi:MAG: hypothetical protein ABEJ97_08685 [Halobellus sp.]
MARFGQSIRRQVRRARNVERFVGLIVAGGLALVAGLWIGTLAPPQSLPWALGVGLALVGVGGLAGGIRRAIDG